MDQLLSKSEKKRRAKAVENLAQELAALPASEIGRLPVDDLLRQEIAACGPLKGGARKRQIKFVAKELRRLDTTALLDFLEQRRGSKLKRDKEFHELERLRDAILTEAINAHRHYQADGDELPLDWQGETIAAANDTLPSLDADTVCRAAIRYARTRKPVHSREIFRQLKAAAERLAFARQKEETDGL